MISNETKTFSNIEIYPEYPESWVIVDSANNPISILDICPDDTIHGHSSGRWLHCKTNIDEKYLYDMKTHTKKSVNTWPKYSYMRCTTNGIACYEWSGIVHRDTSDIINIIKKPTGETQFPLSINADISTLLCDSIWNFRNPDLVESFDKDGKLCPANVATKFVLACDDASCAYTMAKEELICKSTVYIIVANRRIPVFRGPIISGQYICSSRDFICTSTGIYSSISGQLEMSLNRNIAHEAFSGSSMYMPEEVLVPEHTYFIGRTIIMIVNYRSRIIVYKKTIA
jgi:hypothetical protein